MLRLGKLYTGNAWPIRFVPLVASVLVLVAILAGGALIVNTLEAQRSEALRSTTAAAASARAADLQRHLGEALSAADVLAATISAVDGDLARFKSIVPSTFSAYGNVAAVALVQGRTLLDVYTRPGVPAPVTQALLAVLPRPPHPSTQLHGEMLVSSWMTADGEPVIVGQQPVLPGVSTPDAAHALTVIVVIHLRDLLADLLDNAQALAEFHFAYWDESSGGVQPLYQTTATPLQDPVSATLTFQELRLRIDAAPVTGWQRTTLFWRDVLIVAVLAVAVTQATYFVLRRPGELQKEIAAHTVSLAVATQQLEGEAVERRQAEEALRQSQARLLTLINSAADGILSFDATGQVEDFNPSAGRILGMDADSLTKARIWDILPADQHVAFSQYLAQLAEADEEATPLVFEAHAVGHTRVDATIALGRASLATGWLYTAIIHDMSETRRAEELLRAARERLFTVISNAPIVVFAVDANGIFTLSEGSGLTVLGRERGQAVGQSIFEVYRDTPAIGEAIRKALAGHTQSLEVQVGRVVFDATYFPTWNLEGEVTGVMGVAHDVTRRKHAEDALTSVLDTVGDGVVVADEAGQIVMANRQVEQVFGYQPEELIGRNVVDLAPPHLAPAHEAGMTRYRATGEGPIFNQRLQMEGLHRSGRIFPLEIFVGKTYIGNQLHFTASMRDITQEKELERLRDDFISTVSHELRTPLASIMGWLETLMDGRPGPLNEVQARFMKIAYSSAERLNRLVEEILTVSRLNRGTLRLQKLPFDPSQALSAAVDMLDSIAAERDIAIIVNDNWPQRATLIGDRDRFDQVLANLLSNAVKFSPNGGVVEVRSDRVNDEWRLEVSDHGIGIPREEISHLFQRFFRASNAAQAQIQGTGLGLYICRAIVEGHAGRIGIESDVGAGTTVWFSVPVNNELPELPA